MEKGMKDLNKIKEWNGNPRIDNTETEKILNIYLEHRNKSCPPSLFNIIVTIIILIILVLLIIISNV